MFSLQYFGSLQERSRSTRPTDICLSVKVLPMELPMLMRLRAFFKDEAGATSIEYALIAAGIAVVIITAVKGIGTKLNTTFSSISSQLK